MWKVFRLLIVLGSGVAALFSPVELRSVPPVGWGALALILLLGTAGLVAVLTLQASRLRSPHQWQPPAWALNPFNAREPLQFFHLAGYVCLAQGVGALARFFLSSVPFHPELLVPFAMAGALFLGVCLTQLLFGGRIAVATEERLPAGPRPPILRASPQTQSA